MPVRVGLKTIELWNSCLEDAVVEYEKEQQEKGQIVFYGPSYFTRWSDKYGEVPMREALKGTSGKPCVVNRGFGSSCAEHQLYYYPRMVRPLEPKVLVYESYANSKSFGYSLEERWELAQRVVAYAMTDFPGIHVYLCGTNPSRDMTEEDVELRMQYNSWLKAFAEATPDCYYVDVMGYEPLQAKDIFIEDGVHYNSKGYEYYAQLFREALKEELEHY